MSQKENPFRVLFVAAETFSQLGGLQRFNQRVISNLSYFVDANTIQRLNLHIMRDKPESIPQTLKSIACTYEKSWRLLLAIAVHARTCDVLLIGHVNLLPIAWVVKLFNSKIRILMFAHGVEVWDDPVYRRKRFYEPYLMRSLDCIAAVSQFTSSILSQKFGVPLQKITIFPNAVDGPVKMNADKKKERFLLTVARMAEHDHGKNVDAVLRGFAKFPDHLSDVKLDIVGDGVLRSELENLANSLGIADRVNFLGRISDEELAAAYIRATAFILPSSKEGFGIVYLEAWTHALPVICGIEGASKEVVSHEVDGFVADPSKVDELTSYMIKILDDPDFGRDMGERGAQKVSANYLNQNFRENLKELLVNLQ